MQVFFSVSHSLAPTGWENQVQFSRASHSLPYSVSFCWTSFLLFLCLYPLLQPSQSCCLTSVSCSFPASITLFHLPESPHGFPCPPWCTVLEATCHLLLAPQTLIPLCVSVWTLGSPVREGYQTKDCDLGQVHFTGRPSLLEEHPEEASSPIS